MCPGGRDGNGYLERVATTRDAAYAERLAGLQLVSWKERLRRFDPWGWNLRRLRPGFTLDIGCGVGRTLSQIGGAGVGIDHNAEAVAICRARGLRAYLPEEFWVSPWARSGCFDSLLFAHVLEHVEPAEALPLLTRYLRQLRPGGQVIVITPQERGQASDATHVAFVDGERAGALLADAGLVVERQASFPLPRLAGPHFVYNEFITTGRGPETP